MAVKFPYGDADVVSIEDAATSTIAVNDVLTVVNNDNGLSQAVTGLSISRSTQLSVGSMIIFDVLQGATGRNITFASSADTVVAPVLTGVANDRDVLLLVWNGTDWAATTAAWNKIVDAV